MVAAKHQRQRPFFDRRARGLIQTIADFRDFPDELLFRIAVFFGFWNGRCQIAAVGNRSTERRDALAETGNPERRRPHVDAAAAAPHIEGHADQMNGSSHPTTIPNTRLRGYENSS